jgi:hypothetical protein
MIALGASQALEGSTTTASTLTYTISGLLLNTTAPPVSQGYQQLAQGQMATSPGSLYNPGGSNTALISNIHLFNTSGSVPQVVNLYTQGTAGANQIATFTIPAGGWAEYEDGAPWQVYNASGILIANTSIGTPSYGPGGVGTPNTAAQSLTASSPNLITGTSVALATNQLFIGSWYKFILGLKKTTAAGTATWQVFVKFGVNNTTADAAIATWTSGTNTAAIDDAILIIEVVVSSTGASATANCIAAYVNSLTSVTGLGDIAMAPGSTATFNSAATSPYFHIDIQPGASAAMTAVGAAQRMV